jgi:hypothetical protein
MTPDRRLVDLELRPRRSERFEMDEKRENFARNYWGPGLSDLGRFAKAILLRCGPAEIEAKAKK